MQARITRRQVLKLGLAVAGGLTLVASTRCVGTKSTASPTHLPSSSRYPTITPWPAADEIVARTVVPSFPETTFNVTNPAYGAVPGGRKDCTVAFRRAIHDCSASGGGHVVVPAGVYMTGAIHLLSNVDLHLED